jgi:non-specific serine/threonine protein kinase
MFQKLGSLGGIAECLEGLAAVAADGGESDRAAELFGSAAALHETEGFRLSAPNIRKVERELDALRAALGANRFEAAWQIGRELPVGDAIIAALTITSGQSAKPIAAPKLREGAPLTPRELEVAALIAGGRSNREIAEELVIAVSTAERHVANILGKLNLKSRAQVVAWSLEHRTSCTG